jgi:hypothetical protein
MCAVLQNAAGCHIYYKENLIHHDSTPTHTFEQQTATSTPFNKLIIKEHFFY